MPSFCRVDVVKFGADACRCVPMPADAVDAVISHTGRITRRTTTLTDTAGLVQEQKSQVAQAAS